MKVVRQLDKNTWRDFVELHPSGNIFHSPEMFEVFTQTKDHKPVIWASLDHQNRPLALFSTTIITLMDGPFKTLTSRSVAFGGVLSDPSQVGKEALSLLLKTYNREVKNRVVLTELRNLSDSNTIQPILQNNGLLREGHLNFLIDLDRPKKDIMADIKSNARRNIRKAEKYGVTIELVQDLAGVATAYNILQHVYKRLQVPLPDKSLFQSAHQILGKKGMFKLFLARLDGQAIGAMSLLLYKGVATYWYTGTLRDFSKYRANDLLVWHALEWSNENGFRTFDFGGGGKPDEEYGVRDFKAKFGGRLVNFGRNIRVHSPLRFKASKVGYQLYRRFL